MITKTVPISMIKTNGKINIEISKDKLELLMNTCGFFRKDFLDNLEKSENDHKAGRVAKRESLSELMK